MTQMLPLTQGKAALVDDQDAALLGSWKWTYLPNGRSGYAIRWEMCDGQRRTIYMHRQIMEAQPGYLVDHIDGDGLNNQRSNLRLATETQNHVNRAAPARAIPYRGVYAYPRNPGFPWKAQIKASRRGWYLGRYATQEEAARAYDRAALHFFGSFARLNFPNELEATRARPLPRSIARALDAGEQLAFAFDDLDWDDFPPPPTVTVDWFEIATQRKWRQARAALTPRIALDDDWL